MFEPELVMAIAQASGFIMGLLMLIKIWLEIAKLYLEVQEKIEDREKEPVDSK